MKIVKGIAMYTLIAIGVVAAVGILLMGFMFLIPSFKLFGYGFVNNSKTEYLSTYNFNRDTDAGYATENVVLNITTDKGINVHILADSSDNSCSIATTLSNRYYGFYKDNRKITTKTNKVTWDNGSHTMTYDLELVGIDGAINYSEKCYVLVKIPRLKLNAGIASNTPLNYTFNVKTENGDVEVAGANVDGTFAGGINLKSLDVATNKGDLVLNGAGNVVNKHEKPTSASFTHFALSTNGGKFDFSSLTDGVNVTGNVTLNGTRSDYTFTKFNVTGNLEIAGNNIAFISPKLNAANVTYNATSGLFKVTDTLTVPGETSIRSENAAVTLGTVAAGGVETTLGINTQYGDITVGTTNVVSTLIGNHGNIKVTKANKRIIAETVYGDITITEYAESAQVTTTRGRVTAHSTYADVDSEFMTEVILKGKAVVNLTTGQMPFNITSSDNATVNITVTAVRAAFAGEDAVSTVNMTKGTLNIHLDNTDAYKIKATGTISGKPSATLDSITSGTVYEVLFEDGEDVYAHSFFDLRAPKINFV